MVGYGRLKREENFKFIRGGGLQEVSNVVIWLGNFWYFGKLVNWREVIAYERWSQPEVWLYCKMMQITSSHYYRLPLWQNGRYFMFMYRQTNILVTMDNLDVHCMEY